MVTQQQLKEILNYDEKTGVFTWIGHKNGTKFNAIVGSLHHTGYRYITVCGKSYGAHRLAWLYVYGEFPTDMVDHINQKRDDNRISNLRACTRKQNACNRPKQRNNHHKFKGVHRYVWNTGGRVRWLSHIKVDGRLLHLGLYDDIELAAIHYNNAAYVYHGEFACYNDLF